MPLTVAFGIGRSKACTFYAVGFGGGNDYSRCLPWSHPIKLLILD